MVLVSIKYYRYPSQVTQQLNAEEYVHASSQTCKRVVKFVCALPKSCLFMYVVYITIFIHKSVNLLVFGSQKFDSCIQNRPE